MTEQKKYSAAVIGCGKIGYEFSFDPNKKGVYSHAEAYARCEKTDLIAVCDTDIQKAEACAHEWNVPSFFSDYSDMIQEVKPDIISICTPDSTHYEIIRSLLETGGIRAILSEKPLSLQAGNAENLVTRAKEKGIVLAVNYSRRFASSHQWVAGYIRSGMIGKIQSVNGYYTKGIIHNGTHWIDLARFLIGEITETTGYYSIMQSGEDPTIDVLFRFENGCIGFLHGCDENAYEVFEMDIIGTSGRVQITDTGNTCTVFQVTKSPFYSGYLSLEEVSIPGVGDMSDTILHTVEDITECLDSGKKPLCSGEDGLKALLIALKAIQSVKRSPE